METEQGDTKGRDESIFGFLLEKGSVLIMCDSEDSKDGFMSALIGEDKKDGNGWPGMFKAMRSNDAFQLLSNDDPNQPGVAMMFPRRGSRRVLKDAYRTLKRRNKHLEDRRIPYNRNRDMSYGMTMTFTFDATDKALKKRNWQGMLRSLLSEGAVAGIYFLVVGTEEEITELGENLTLSFGGKFEGRRAPGPKGGLAVVESKKGGSYE
jgi:hypothetical protein